MRIFITGCSGFIGGAVGSALKDQYEILAMARSESAAQKIRSIGITPVITGLETIESSHLKNCDVVIHCAAYAEEWGTEQEYFKANVEGTKNLLIASKSAGVKRFIFIGTEAALFSGQDLVRVTESYPYAKNSPYPYSRTKAIAEEFVLNANSPEFQTISLRPRFVWGPGDVSVLPVLLQMVKDGNFRWINHGAFSTSTTHISNLVHAIGLAVSNGRPGQPYFIADDEISTLKNFLTLYVGSQGMTLPNRSVPKSVARSTAYIVEKIWKLSGLRLKPPVVRFTVDMMSSNCTVDTSKAKKELGYEPVISVKQGLEAMLRSY